MRDETTHDQSPKRPNRWVKTGILFSILGAVIFIAAISFAYYQLACVNISLAKEVVQTKEQLAQNQVALKDTQQHIEDLQQNLQKSQQLTQQQEQLVTEWRTAQTGNLEKWYVAEAAALVKQANDQSQLLQNMPLALTLLQRAEQVLQNVSSENVQALRKSLAEDIARVQALPVVDITGLYSRLMSLDARLNQLPLPVNPLKTENAPQATTAPTDLPWWKAGIENAWQSLKQLVVVRNIQTAQPPLVLPEEKFFLYQNMHTQIQNAVWGALHRNEAVYQLSLAQLLKWIPQYFAQDEAVTKEILATVNELIKIDVQQPPMDFANTIQLFDQYFSQMQAPQVSQAREVSEAI